MDNNKPGCFGSALTFKAASSECVNCVFAKMCEPVHVTNLEILRKKLGIEVKEKRKKTVVEEAKIENPDAMTVYPNKVVEFLDKLDQKKISIKASMREGKNPFENSYAFLKIACHLLMKLKHGFSDDLLKTAFMTKLNLSEQTAKTYVAQARQILLASGAITYSQGSMRLKDDL